MSDNYWMVDTRNALWQVITKEHMEQNVGESITDEEWKAFIDRFQTAFAEEVSELAMEYWSDKDLY
jgi:hypothetical protein